jgi:uncharacterized alkaline shock family protein YloU
MGKVADRLLLFLFSIAILFCSAIVLIASFGWIGYGTVIGMVNSMYESAAVNYAVIGVSAVLLVLALRFLFVALRTNRERVGSIDQRTEFGDVRISLETVENLSLKAAMRVRGVKDLRARIGVNEKGLLIQLRTVIDGESSIPQLTEELQRGVKAYVEEVTGIPVATVTVFVANVVQTQTFKARVE